MIKHLSPPDRAALSAIDHDENLIEHSAIDHGTPALLTLTHFSRMLTRIDDHSFECHRVNGHLRECPPAVQLHVYKDRNFSRPSAR